MDDFGNDLYEDQTQEDLYRRLKAFGLWDWETSAFVNPEYNHH